MDVSAAHLWIPLAWGLLLLASWTGWGEWTALFLKMRHVDFGLRAGWGMSLTLAIAGWLQWSRACNASALAILVYLGVIFLAAGIFLRLRAHTPTPQSPPLTPAPSFFQTHGHLLPATLLLAIAFLLSARTYYLNDWDDYPAYLVFAKNLLHDGSIDQPYSLRRLLSFGGQQLLDAQLLLHASFQNIDLLEQGLCRIFTIALVAGMFRPRTRRQQIIATIFLAALVFLPREHLPLENTHSEMTGLVLFLTLLRTLAIEGRTAWRAAIVAGIVGAAACSMRANYIPAAVFMIAFCYAARMLLDRPRRAHVAHLLLAAAIFALALLPWSLVLLHTSGTLVNPPFLGNQRPEYSFFAGSITPLQRMTSAASFIVLPAAFVMLVPLLLATSRRFRRTEFPLALAAALTALMVLLSFPMASAETSYRYIFPFTFAVTLAVVYRTLLHQTPPWQNRLALVAAILIGIAQVPLGIWYLAYGRTVVPPWRVPVSRVESAELAYRAAQNTIPAREQIFSVTSFPILFDFARNRIVIADIPGAASPPPGLPLFDGASAVAAYLKKQGIHYIIFDDAGDVQNMYSRKYWNDVHNHPENATAEIRQAMRFNLAFIGLLDDLAKTNRVLFHRDTLTVIELQ